MVFKTKALYLQSLIWGGLLILIGVVSDYPITITLVALFVNYFILKYSLIQYEVTKENICKKSPISLVKSNRKKNIKYQEIFEVNVFRTMPKGTMGSTYVCQLKLNNKTKKRLLFSTDSEEIFGVMQIFLDKKIIVRCNSHLMKKYRSIYQTDKASKFLLPIY